MMFYEDKDGMATSLIQMIRWHVLGQVMEVPKSCALCHTARKGSFITGFYLPCEDDHYNDSI